MGGGGGEESGGGETGEGKAEEGFFWNREMNGKHKEACIIPAGPMGPRERQNKFPTQVSPTTS